MSEKMTSEKIFFSYTKEDSEFVLKLAKDLRNTGVDIWLNQLDIKPGSLWHSSIETALNSANCMIVILSPAAVNSNYVMDEVSYAMDEGKRVIPIILKKCRIPLRLSRLQVIDFTEDYNQGINQLLKAIGLETQAVKTLALRLIEENKKTKSKSLNLSSCGMKEIPPEISELIWLEELIVAGKSYYDYQKKAFIETINKGPANSFTEIPSGIKKLKKLKKLIVSGSGEILRFTDISIFQHLSNLEYLDISFTQTTNISIIASLKKLLYLNIANTQIEDISVISKLADLLGLDFSYSYVQNISAVSNLLNLQDLSFSNTSVTDISAVSNLINLQRLIFSNTSVTDISTISNLINLQFLYFHNTQVNNISHVANLKKLHSLIFANTQVKDISPLVNLKNLKGLDFSNCRVVNLIELVNLENLLAFECKGNPIKDCPSDVYETGDPKQLRAYFKAKQSEKITNIETTDSSVSPTGISTEEIDLRRDVKLIVLGNSNVGKTNLVNYLEKGIYAGNRKTTHGLEVHRWLPDKERFSALKDIAVSIWDFGGQEYYHEAYRLFLSSNAVYLLLWCSDSDRNGRINTCLNDDEPTVELEHFEIKYWLDTIQHYGVSNVNAGKTIISTQPTVSSTDKKTNSTARLIAVQNKVDDIELDKKRIAQELHEKYKISDSFHISLLKGSDIDNLRQNKTLKYFLSELESVILSNADIEKPPANWQKIRSEILSLKDEKNINNPFQQKLEKELWINLANFKKACKSLVSEFSDDEAYTLPRWLDKGGVVVYFPDIPALADKIFIRPDRLAENIYSILSEKVRLKGGEFSATDIFSHEEKEIKTIFLELAKQLDLVFPHPVKTTGEYYLAPQYLPDNHPIEDLFKIASQGAWQSQLWVKVPLFYYKKILHGLLLHFASEKNTECRYFWKHGIMFVNEGLRVLIKGLYPDRLQQEGIILLGVEYDVQKREVLQKKIFNKMLQILTIKTNTGMPSDMTAANNKATGTEAKTTDPKFTKPAIDIQVSYDGENYVAYNYLLDNSEEPKVKASNSNSLLITHNFAAILPAPPQKAKRVFLSYSHQNTQWLGRLRTHLAGLRRAKMIETWDDKEILPGDLWDATIKKNLEEADIFILLLSADFIASEYIWNDELRTAFRKLKQRNAMVIPVLFEPLDLGGLSEITENTDKTSYKISDFEIIPKNAEGRLQAVSLWQNQEEALAKIAERIRDAIQKK